MQTLRDKLRVIHRLGSSAWKSDALAQNSVSIILIFVSGVSQSSKVLALTADGHKTRSHERNSI